MYSKIAPGNMAVIMKASYDDELTVIFKSRPDPAQRNVYTISTLPIGTPITRESLYNARLRERTDDKSVMNAWITEVMRLYLESQYQERRFGKRSQGTLVIYGGGLSI